MEYAQPFGNDGCDPCDSGYVKHVGYSEDNACIREYYSRETMNTISYKVTELLMGVDPQNRPIIVPDRTICGLMSEIYDSYRPTTGDIYGRYNVPNNEPQNMVQDMINQVINIIVTDVKTNLETEQNNAKLSIWTTVLGDGVNEAGLRSHPPIKMKNKRPAPFQFNMNY
jgi:hypothetical protein